jgi:hypothetical protein
MSRAATLLGFAVLAAIAAAGWMRPHSAPEAVAMAAPPLPRPITDPRPDQARRAAEEYLRGRLRSTGALTSRAAQVHRQALPDSFAVCGQVMQGTRGEAWLPYVATIAFEAGEPRVTELVLGSTGAEATRVFMMLLDHCFEGGGAAMRGQARPLPPMPDQAPSAARRPAEPPPAVQPAATAPRAAVPPPGPPQPVAGTVTVNPRTPANIRNQPGGGGEVVRSAGRGATLEVFGTAPGGWLQVGADGAPWGWVHTSLLEPRQ